MLLTKFASTHANIHNHFNLERHLVDRQTYRERRSAPWLSDKPSWRDLMPEKLLRQSKVSCE